MDWARRLLEGLAEHEKLDLVVDGEHTSSGNTTEDVGASTLEERLDTLLGDDLLEGIDGRLVLDGLGGTGQYLFVTEARNIPQRYSPHQTSSSCDGGQCQAGRKRYRHRW